MENELSKYITNSRNSHGTQHLFITMLEKFKSALDKGENVCVLFMDVSKAFDTINQDLLVAKWKAYGFSKNALELMCSRGSRSEMFLVKGALKKCSKVTGEHPCQSVISIKLHLQLYWNHTLELAFSCNLLHIFRTSFLKNTSGWLLLV